MRDKVKLLSSVSPSVREAGGQEAVVASPPARALGVSKRVWRPQRGVAVTNEDLAQYKRWTGQVPLKSEQVPVTHNFGRASLPLLPLDPVLCREVEAFFTELPLPKPRGYGIKGFPTEKDTEFDRKRDANKCFVHRELQKHILHGKNLPVSRYTIRGMQREDVDRTYDALNEWLAKKGYSAVARKMHFEDTGWIVAVAHDLTLPARGSGKHLAKSNYAHSRGRLLREMFTAGDSVGFDKNGTPRDDHFFVEPPYAVATGKDRSPTPKVRHYPDTLYAAAVMRALTEDDEIKEAVAQRRIHDIYTDYDGAITLGPGGPGSELSIDFVDYVRDLMNQRKPYERQLRLVINTARDIGVAHETLPVLKARNFPLKNVTYITQVVTAPVEAIHL